MKVIFLDIDGVLNSDIWNENHQFKVNNGEYIDEYKVKLLSQIVKKTKAVVVLHSGWRFWLNDNLQPINKEAAFLITLLKKYNIKIYDKTPDFSTDEIRKTKKFSLIKAKEIMAWIEEHQNVKTYLVLEDLYLYNENISKHQIKTDSHVGLTEQEVENAIKILNKI